MPPKSRRKRKHSGHRRAQTALSVARGAARQPSQPATQVTPAARTRPSIPKTPVPLAPTISATYVGRELRTIGIVAGVLLVGLIVLSLVLS